MPSYLRFMRGVVDSEDMPLNISREMLQNNPQVAQIRKALTGRVIGELESLAEKEAETFAKVWEAFGKVLKEGLYEDRELLDGLRQVLARKTCADERTFFRLHGAGLVRRDGRAVVPCLPLYAAYFGERLRG